MARHDENNVTRYWTDARIGALGLMCADFTTQEFAPHIHEGFVVAATEAGGAKVKSRGVIGEAHASRLYVFNPAEPHSGWMGGSARWRYRSFYLPPDAIDEIARGLGMDRVPHFIRNDFADADLIAMFLRLHRALERNQDLAQRRELFLNVFGTLFRRHGSSERPVPAAPKDRALFDTVARVVRERFNEHLLLDDLAEAVSLTPFQLIGLFKRHSGLTPHAYLTQFRLREACRRLREGSSITDAALLSGFYDQSALTNHFKRTFGFTPLQFAKAAA